MVIAAVSGSSSPGSEPWPGTLPFALGQGTLLSQFLSLPANLMLGLTL